MRVERVHHTLPLSMCGMCDVAVKAMPVCVCMGTYSVMALFPNKKFGNDEKY